MIATGETQSAPTSIWTRRAKPIDLVVIALTVVMAALTLWVASAPVGDLVGFLLLGIVWLPIGGVWALSLIVASRPNAAFVVIVTIVVLLLGVGSFIQGLASVPFVVFTGLVLAGGAVLIANVLLGRPTLLGRSLPVVWLVAPAIVLVTIALVLSGLPKIARFAIAEPALTAHAIAVLGQPRVGSPEEMPSVSVAV